MTSPLRDPGEGSKSARTRRRILASAAHELSRHGYGGTSLRKVAAGAGMQQGSLYFHFASKDELVGAVLAEGVDLAIARITAALDALPDDVDGRTRLAVAVREHVAALHADRDLAAAVVGVVATLPAELRALHSAHERRYGRLWRDVLEHARREGLVDATIDVERLTGFVIWGLNSFVESARDEADEDLDATTAAVVELLVGRGPRD